jgi:tRNA (guanine10-N2)-dimethyltransferase
MMKERRFLFELSGEHPTLPSAEVMGMLAADAPGAPCEFHPGVAIAGPCDAASAASRLALTHRVGEYVGCCDREQINEFLASKDLPDGSIAVRGRGFGGFADGGAVNAAVKKVASIVARGREVDLDHPDVELRFIMSDLIYFHIKLAEVDRTSFEMRKVAERPFFSPISLHPRYARALVNIAGVRSGDSVLDPFCGTGGTLIEAAMIGARCFGSDVDGAMIDGTRCNMEHFHLSADQLSVLDIDDASDSFPDVDAVLTDLPYGRSASTMKEGVPALYARAVPAMHRCLRAGGRFGIVAPRAMDLSPLTLDERHEQKVHRSLTRHYHFGVRAP